MAFSSALYLLLLVITVSESKPQIGGTDAADGAYPYAAFLQTAGTKQCFCTCSIISPDWILTAAHCVNPPKMEPFPADAIKVVVGTNSVESGGITYDVLQIIYHDGFSKDTAQNDIAVIRVGPMTFGPKVQSIPMATSDLPGGSSVVSVGWGKTNANDENSGAKTLQVSRLISMSAAECQASTPGITSTQMCTKGVAGKGTCEGDSGGPLTFGYVQYGLDSFSRGPCGGTDPEYYTNVASFRPWIKEKTGL